MRKSKLEWQRKRRLRMSSAERDAKRSYERDYYSKNKARFSDKNHRYYMRRRLELLTSANERYASNRDSINSHRRELYLTHSVSFEFMERRRLLANAWKSMCGSGYRSSKRRSAEARTIRENILMARDPTYYAFVRERNRQYMMSYRRKCKPNSKPYVPKNSMRIPNWCPFAYSGIDFRSRFMLGNIGTEEKAFVKSLRPLG